MKALLPSALAVVLLGTLACVLTSQPVARAHCQVPCGIYDDAARIKHMLEDVSTIEKATHQIQALSGKHDPQALNQATRWIMTKEQHAAHIITTVAEYFLTQKVKDPAPGSADYAQYLERLAVHHRVMRNAMKTKQSVDLENVKSLHQAVEALGKLY